MASQPHALPQNRILFYPYNHLSFLCIESLFALVFICCYSKNDYCMVIVISLPVRLYSIGMALRSKQSVESTLPVRFITPEYVWL